MGFAALATLGLLALLLSARSLAAPGDYAYGWPLETPAGADLYELSLPLPVYAASRHAGLRDLAVFNAAGRAVPHRLVTRAGDAGPPDPLTVPVFPVGSSATGDRGLDLAVERRPNGSILRLQVQNPQVGGVAAAMGFYVLDAPGRPRPRPLQALGLHWEGGGESFVGRLRLEGGADLQTWQAIGTFTVASLQENGHTLVQRRIPLAGTAFRYYRLIPLDLPADWRLTRVEAEPVPPKAVRWETTDVLVAATDPGAQAWSYSLPGALPVERLSLAPGSSTFLTEARIQYRRNPGASWRHAAQAVFWQVRGPDGWLYNDPLAVPAVAARYWRLVFAGRPPETTRPLRVHWRARTLVFLAEGEGPFTLAVGRGKLPDEAGQGHRTLQTLWETRVRRGLPVAMATLGRRQELGGTSRLEVIEPLPWKTWLLWVVLVLGAVVLVAMAVRLLKTT